MRAKQATLFFLGLYVCLVATIAHRQVMAAGGVELPWGLALALVATYSVARTGENWVRLGGAFFALGWAVSLTVPMFSPGGSYLIAQDWIGLSFMFGSLALLALAVIRGSRTP